MKKLLLLLIVLFWLSTTFLHDPQVLLIDEPIIGLDLRGVRMLKKLLGEFALKGGSIFMATHSLLLAEELCSNLGIIHKGRLIARGTKEELLARSGGLEDFFLQVTEESNHSIQGGIR